MLIHRASIDDPVAQKASEYFDTYSPTAISEFSRVEIKSALLQSMILLRKKIEKSYSFTNACVRIINSRDRKAKLMLAMLAEYLGGLDLPVHQWDQVKNQFLTIIDSQIPQLLENICIHVDYTLSDFNCSRAYEEPEEAGDSWKAPIAICRKENTSCTIDKFMNDNLTHLNSLLTYLQGQQTNSLTDELKRIMGAIGQILKKGDRPKCRSIGDLLIALQGKDTKQLISSNFHEHKHLSQGIGYKYIEFPVSQIRSK
jgi:hypothetical protein